MRPILAASFAAAALLIASPAHAAAVRFSAVDVADRPGTTEVRLFLDTEGLHVNVMEGSISVSGDGVQLLDSTVGGGVGSFWMEPPKREGNTARFSFLTPGGIGGNDLPVLSLFISSPASGSVHVQGFGMAVYQHDGKGTRISIADQSFEYGAKPLPKRPAPLSDATPPAEFQLEIVNEPLLGEAPTLLFNTKDEGAGLDHYELLFSERPLTQTEIDAAIGWVIAESPHALPPHVITPHVYVKAVDKAGNERLSHIEFPSRHSVYVPYLALAAIFLMLGALLAINIHKPKP